MRQRMKMRLVLTVAMFLLIPSMASAEGNPNPHLVLRIHSSEVDEVPSGTCLYVGDDQQSEIQCYDVKLGPGSYAFLSVHVTRAPNGFTGLPFGIMTVLAPVTFVEFVPCPGFMTVVSDAGMPAAIMVTSTIGCRQPREAVGFLKYVCVDTLETIFATVPNADLGHYQVINCDYTYDVGTTISNPAQWGGERELMCPWAGDLVDIEAGTWGKIKSLYR